MKTRSFGALLAALCILAVCGGDARAATHLNPAVEGTGTSGTGMALFWTSGSTAAWTNLATALGYVSSVSGPTGITWSVASNTATGSWSSESANTVLAGPTSGSAAAPAFRGLVAADLPATGVTAGSYTSANITVNAEGQVTAAANGSGGSGSLPTVNRYIGAGSNYTLTDAYAPVSFGGTTYSVTLPAAGTYRIYGSAEVTAGAVATPTRVALYDSSVPGFLPSAETRRAVTAGSTAQTFDMPFDFVGTFSGADTLELYATSAQATATGTLTSYRTSLSYEAVNSASAQTQQSNTLPYSTGLVAWYKADAITGVANGGNVTTWADSSGSGNTLTAGTTAPTLEDDAWNGLPGVYYNNTSTTGMTTSAPPTTNLTYDMFAVVQSPSATPAGGKLLYNGNSSTSGYGIVLSTSAAATVGFLYGTVGSGYASPVYPTNGWVLVELQRTSAGATTLYIDGVSAVTSTDTPVTPATVFQVGGENGQAIGEVLVFNAPLSSGNQTAVTSYLMSKWGL